MYDYIIIGSSLPCLIKALFINESKILILEKSNYLGGSWRSKSDTFKNVELGCHVIVPPDDASGLKIIDKFKEFNIPLKFVTDRLFFSDSDDWKYYGKEGKPIICSRGWVYFLNSIIKLVKNNGNITIMKNITVNEVISENNSITIKCNDHLFVTKKVIIPSYCSINNIIVNKRIINLTCEYITSMHNIILVEKKDVISPLYFNGFYEKTPKKMFDRISTSELDNDNMVICCRISKDFKNNSNLKDKLEIKKLLIERKIISEKANLLNYDIYKYNCVYRNSSIRKSIEKKLENYENIIFLKTHYMGHFLDELIHS